eukprot:15519225-Heterocapsa_arctica.AAC.1
MAVAMKETDAFFVGDELITITLLCVIAETVNFHFDVINLTENHNLLKTTPLLGGQGLFQKFGKPTIIDVIFHALLPEINRSTMDDLSNLIATQLPTLP